MDLSGSSFFNEVEFELSATQHEKLGPVTLSQGQPIELTLETSVLLPDPSSESWFTVQPDPITPRFERVSPGTYAFSGKIQDAEIENEDGDQIAFLLVACSNVQFRVICGPGADGRLPWGTWESRYLTGVSRLHGLIEDDYATSIGHTFGATIWQVSRLILTPGDLLFGQWHHGSELTAAPYSYDKIFITSRLHKGTI